jgi:hypothetical protein
VLVEHARARTGYVEPEERKIDVEVLYRKNNIAAAQLTSARFNDFVQLVQIDGEWKILNVLWTAVRGDPSGPPELNDPALQEKQAIEAIENYLTAVYSADAEKLIGVIHPELSIAQYKIIESTGRPTIERSGASFITELCRAGYLKNAVEIQSQEVQVLGMMNEMAFLRFKSIRANVFFQMQLIENQWRIINILSVPGQA